MSVVLRVDAPTDLSLFKIFLKYCPVQLVKDAAGFSGGSSVIVSPPLLPPSGPRSIIQSAVLLYWKTSHLA